MNSIISNLISGILGAILGSVISIYGSIAVQKFAIRSDAKSKYIEKMEETKLLLAQIKEWMDSENMRWYKRIELRGKVGRNTLDCPVYKVQALIEAHEPSLSNQVEKMIKEVSNMRDMDINIFENFQNDEEMVGSDIKKTLEEFDRSYSNVNESLTKKINDARKDISKSSFLLH